MAQEESGQNGFWRYIQDNKITAIALAIIVLALVAYLVGRGDKDEDNTADTNQGTEQSSNSGNNGQSSEGEKPRGDQPAPAASGNISVAGTVKQSDNAAKGNYMLVAPRGKYYVKTSRDYSALVDKSATLSAQGDVNSYKFLGFSSQVAGEETDMGGAPDADSVVRFSGTLAKSDSGRGNYTITSGSTTVYFQTARDYSAWVGSNVTLHGNGALSSFSGAYLTK